MVLSIAADAGATTVVNVVVLLQRMCGILFINSVLWCTWDCHHLCNAIKTITMVSTQRPYLYVHLSTTIRRAKAVLFNDI